MAAIAAPPPPPKANSPDYFHSLTRRIQSLFKQAAPATSDEVTWADAKAIVSDEKIRQHYLETIGGHLYTEYSFNQSANAQVLFTIDLNSFTGQITINSGGRSGVANLKGDAKRLTGASSTHVILGTYHWERDEAQRRSTFVYIELATSSVDIVFYDENIEEVAYISADGDRYVQGHAIGKITWNPPFGSF